MLNSADVKDKNIRLENFKYRANVEYYSGRMINCGLFESLYGAQRELKKYPPDVWDGFDMQDPRFMSQKI